MLNITIFCQAASDPSHICSFGPMALLTKHVPPVLNRDSGLLQYLLVSNGVSYKYLGYIVP